MGTINIYIKTDNVTLSEKMNPNSQVSLIFDIIRIKTGYDISNTHILQHGTHILDEFKKLDHYNINNGSTIRTNFSIRKLNFNKKVDFIGMYSYQNLVNELGQSNDTNEFIIVSLMSFNIEKDNLIKNLSQQLQPTTIVEILNSGKINLQKKIIINLILIDLAFIDYNLNYLNNNFKILKNNPQINDILNLKLCDNFTSLNNRIIKFKTNSNNIKTIFKYLNISDDKIINQIEFNFYFVGMDIKSEDPEGNFCSISYESIKNKSNLFINMWTQEKVKSN